MTDTGIYVQTTEPYQDLFLAEGDSWARSDDRVYVYAEGRQGDPLAEIEAEYFVSAAETTEEAVAHIPTTADDAEVSP